MAESLRPWWLGFALSGWGYLALAFWSARDMPMMALLDVIGSRLGVTVRFLHSGMGGGGMSGCGVSSLEPSVREIGRCCCVWLVALLGGVIATAIFGGGGIDRGSSIPIRPRPLKFPEDGGALTGGCCTGGKCAHLGSRLVRLEICSWPLGGRDIPFDMRVAGYHNLGSCWRPGKVATGLARRRGVRRGLHDPGFWPFPGYGDLAGSADRPFAVCRPRVVSSARLRLLNRLGRHHVRERAIHQALEQAVPMRFPQETPLEEVLKYIQSATRGPDDKRIPIYVEPVGFQEAEKNMTSTVAIELEGVALKTSLRVCLKQLCLSYSVRDGLLLITSEERLTMPIYQDPFLIVGHCLLALLAAGFGGSAAPRVWLGPAWAARR